MTFAVYLKSDAFAFKKRRLPGVVCREMLGSAGASQRSWQPSWPVWMGHRGVGR